MDLEVVRALVKHAKEEVYRRAGNVKVDRDIPIIRLPKAPEAAREKLLKEIRDAKTERWTHPQVAVKNLPLEQMGFEKTIAAIPLPGEKFFTPSYRSGELHAHKMGPYYLVHEDKADPKGGVWSGFKHVLLEGLPALKRRLFEDIPPPVLSKPPKT